jgi:hypothetical protein
VFAEQAAGAAINGDLEAARVLADKSALAMTGEVDLSMLPSLDGVPIPGEPAAYAAATAEAINQASDCLHKMDNAQKDMARADQIAATSPEEAAAIRKNATQVQDDAQARLKEILANVSAYKSNPSLAGSAVVVLQSGQGVVTPSGITASSGTTTSTTTQVAQTTTTTSAEDWAARSAKWRAELDEVHKQIASTRNVLLKLNASVQADGKLFSEWEKDADAGFDRCVNMATDTVIDFNAGALAERREEMYKLAKKLPDNPEALIEKYRYLASLAQRLKEAKSTNEVAGLAAREGKTEQEIYEEIRDGIGQISGLLGLDKTVPGAIWKYCSQAADMAYNLTELRQLWKNVGQLEQNNARYAEAVKKLSERMQKLVEREKELKRQIEAGEAVDFAK